VAKLPFIELSNGVKIPILHEDRNVIAIDKPQGWMLAPISWQNTGRNLFAALSSSMNAGDFWAKSRSLKFIRFVHRLDADTSGVLLLVKTPGAVPAYTELFEERGVEKVYLAVVNGVPEVNEWRCELCIAPVPDRPGFMEINNTLGKDAETIFRVVDKRADRALVMCWPKTGRTHQIRLHLAAVGHPVLGDELYGPVPATTGKKVDSALALRAIRLSYRDPFKAETVTIDASVEEFVKAHGFDPSLNALQNRTEPEKVLEHPKGRLEKKRREPRPERPPRGHRPRRSLDRQFEDAPREDWQQDEDSGGFAEEAAQRPPYRERGPRSFGGAPRGGKPFGKPPFGGPRKFGGPREFGGGREERRPYAPRGEGDRPYADRPPRFAKKPFGGPRSFGDERGEFRPQRPRSFGQRDDRGGEQPGDRRDFRSGPPRKPGYGRPFEDRGERRPYGSSERRPYGGGGGGFNRDRDERGPAGESRPGVFRSSARTGLRSGFQKPGGFEPRGEGRPFRPAREGGRPQGEWRGAGSREGGRPPGKFGGKKPFGGGKPAWGKKPMGRPFKKFSGPR
jgi:23S rRNA pseudouridine1911/1915/1917 synthase